MLFNSIDYLLFLPIVFLVYWILNANYRWQNILLLIASYVFYAWWDWRFLSLIVYSSLIDYIIGLKIPRTNSEKAKKNLLLLSLVSNLGLLAVFKYFNFFTSSFAQLMHSFGWQVDTVTLNIILPVGISFYTFQTLSYTIDIYREKLEPSKSVVDFFTYVSFFPQLVAGPIERASNLLPQIASKRKISIKDFKEGIFQISIGLFRKIVIADNLAIYVDSIYSDVSIHNSSSLLLATVFYAFQIYFDFAGYSDIAIGSAKLFGFRFERNFNTPYFSRSLTEFWRKWHISLSSWLRDYLYISLGGNRNGRIKTYRNLMLTMLLGGLWHGSSWNFVIWGGIHGVFLAMEKMVFSKLGIKNFNALGGLYTFLVVLLSWVFFRAISLDDSAFVVSKMLEFDYKAPFIGNINTLVIGAVMLFIGIGFDIGLNVFKAKAETVGGRFSIKVLGLIISIMIITIVLFYSTSENFIYFQF